MVNCQYALVRRGNELQGLLHAFDIFRKVGVQFLARQNVANDHEVPNITLDQARTHVVLAVEVVLQ